MKTAQQVKDMADSLSNINSQLCACVGLDELMPAQERAGKRITEACGMKCRSKSANESLEEAIGWATEALARSQISIELRAKEGQSALALGDLL